MDKFLSTVEVSHIMGVHVNNISRLCRDGRVPGAIQISGRWLIPESSVSLIKKDESKLNKKYKQAAS